MDKFYARLVGIKKLNIFDDDRVSHQKNENFYLYLSEVIAGWVLWDSQSMNFRYIFTL